ncbi:MAG: HAD family hydrolase [Terracoccus sp.]
MSAKVRGILLDFYGTVALDDDAVVDAISKRVASDTGAPLTTVASLWWQSFCGLCAGAHGESFRLQSVLARDSLATVLDELGSGLDADELVAPQLAHWSAPLPFEDALQFLEAAELPVLILSDIDTGHLEDALGSLGLSQLPYVTSEQTRAYKPRPEGFRSGLARLGLPAHQVVHVGNSWSSDVLGAAAAGIHPVWVNRTRRARPDATDRPVVEVTGLGGLDQRLRRPWG